VLAETELEDAEKKKESEEVVTIEEEVIGLPEMETLLDPKDVPLMPVVTKPIKIKISDLMIHDKEP
jgi:hypothetical protein